MKNKNTISKSFRIFVGILLIISGLSTILGTFDKGGSNKNINFVPYQYGDVISRENTKKDSRFKLKDNVKIIIDEQVILTKEEIKKINEFNDDTNEVSLITISIINDSDEKFNINGLGLDFATESGFQMSNSYSYIGVLPEPYSSMDTFSGSEIMPGNKMTRLVINQIPDGDEIKTIYWKYFGTEFTVVLPWKNRKDR